MNNQDKIEGVEDALTMLRDNCPLEAIYEMAVDALYTEGKAGEDYAEGMYAMLSLLNEETYPAGPNFPTR